MAAQKPRKVLRVRVTVPRDLVAKPLFHTLSEKFKLVHNTLQGRISAEGAWLEVELRGSARNIDRALVHLEKLGVTVDPLRD